MRNSSALVLVVVLAGLTAAAQANKTRRHPPPPAAQLVIDAVTRAARERDFVGLHQAMSDPFFDGVSASISADAALAVWQRKPDLLDVLLSCLQQCQAEGGQRVGCPPGSGTLALEPS